MRKTILIIALLSIVVWACTKQSLKTTYDKQATFIDNFVTAQMKADTTATLVQNGGAWRLTLKDTIVTERDSLDYGGRVTMEYASYILTGASVSASNLVETSRKDIATSAGWVLSDTTVFAPVTLTLDKNLVEGLRLGLHGVQPQDECYVLFTGEYGYGNKENGTIPAKSALVYHLWIESIDNE